jgi:type VI secretion system secreted protein VgrG
MATYLQAGRPMTVATPLGPDALLLVGFNGYEAISQLFSFQLDLLAENHTDIPFDKLLGQGITVSLALPDDSARYFTGLCSRISQGHRDQDFTAYRMEIVPEFWLLTKRAQSRIFQHMTVPDILKKVLAGLDVKWEIQGRFEERDYCVQYRETDFNFASRLMEEEGIYYFFVHGNGSHTMVLANTPQSHPDLPYQSSLIYETVEGGQWKEDRIHVWEKQQELRSGKYTLRDHCFELPHKHLDAEKLIQDSVAAGSVTHNLKVGGNDRLELYDYPGEYAQRFDGVDKAGGEQPSEVQKIYQDNKRTVAIRMQQEAMHSLIIRGSGAVRQMVSGHKFTLERHFNANGPYVLLGVEHHAEASNYRTDGSGFNYHNTFTCIPLDLPYRPARTTPKPFVQGTQTALVVGPMGKEEIFTDKYGRVKVQFHWDRQGQYNADSSCWIRVATAWAGKSWGQINIPRIGHEVIVAFLEGDPDNPIIVGSVYNAENMPARKLPEGRKVSGLVSRTNKPSPGYNQITCDDTKDNELIQIHGQYDLQGDIEHDERWTVHNNRTIQVDGTHTETITKDTKIKIESGTYDHDVAGNTAHYHVSADIREDYDATQTTNVGGNITIKSGASIQITAATDIQLHVGASTLLMKSDGSIQLNGVNIGIDGKTQVNVHGGQVISAADSAHHISGGSVVSEASGTNTVQGGTVLLNP